jgi:hypothetical protein
VHTPKTAGMSIHAWFFKNFRDSNHEVIEGHKFSRETLAEFGPQGFSFCVIRNPWDWYVSRYCHYIKTHPEKDFHFVDFLMLSKYGINGKLIRSVTPMVFEKYYEDLDFVIKYEELEEGFKTIQNITNCYDPLGTFNTVEDKPPYSYFYNEELKELVYARHKIFIDEWGYTFDDQKPEGAGRKVLRHIL